MRGSITLTVMVVILMMGLTFAPTVLAENAWNEEYCPFDGAKRAKHATVMHEPAAAVDKKCPHRGTTKRLREA